MPYIEGTVVEIVYRNEENAYTVLELDAEGNLIVCVGNIPMIQPGEYVRFYGAYATHKNYGRQFKVTGMESRMPDSDESIRMFLAGGLIKGVGEILAYRIVERFSADTFQVIEQSPEELAEVQGVSFKLAMRIHEQFMDMQTVRSIIMQLQKMGLTVKEALAAYEAYGAGAPFLISKNPYRLMEDVRGIGFYKADAIAQGLGLDNYQELRRKSGILHLLGVKMQAGHTCFPRDQLIAQGAEFLQEGEEEIEEAVKALLIAGQLSENSYRGTLALALSESYLAESYSAKKLLSLLYAKPKVTLSRALPEKILSEEEMLSEEQKEAVLMAMESQVSIITGGPGTGKTTILNQILQIYEKSGVATLLAAPTGRAAKRMEMATGRPAKTIHRLLEYGSEPGEETLPEYTRFRRDEDNPLEADAVIIDESSMVDVFLLRSLLQAIEGGTRLLFTGDADQLPSVGPGNVLRDMIKSGILPCSVLSKVYRSGGNIVLNAHKVNRGEDIELFRAGDFVFLPCESGEEVLETTLKAYREAVGSGLSMDEVQIICPIKKGEIGVYNLNKQVREQMNPRLAAKEELTFGDTTFRVGDKVMQTVNNYSKEWYVRGASRILTEGAGAFNGDMGVIERIDLKEKTLFILFDGDRLAEYDQSELSELEHAYAVTVHKSQGSEFDTVILPLYYGYSDFLTRNLLYTALTRAKRKLIIIGRERTVKNMIANARISHRYTALSYELLAEEALVKDLLEKKSHAEFQPLSDVFN